MRLAAHLRLEHGSLFVCSPQLARLQVQLLAKGGRILERLLSLARLLLQLSAKPLRLRFPHVIRRSEQRVRIVRDGAEPRRRGRP